MVTMRNLFLLPAGAQRGLQDSSRLASQRCKFENQISACFHTQLWISLFLKSLSINKTITRFLKAKFKRDVQFSNINIYAYLNAYSQNVNL